MGSVFLHLFHATMDLFVITTGITTSLYWLSFSNGLLMASSHKKYHNQNLSDIVPFSVYQQTFSCRDFKQALGVTHMDIIPQHANIQWPYPVAICRHNSNAVVSWHRTFQQVTRQARVSLWNCGDNRVLLTERTTGLNLGLCLANERRCYFVTTSLIGWAPG